SSEAEKKRAVQASSRPGTSNSSALSRQGSITSVISTQSLQPHVPIDAGNGQYFRPYQFLHNRLEFFHDTVGSMLNHQLESKNEAFWKTVNSYGTLHGQLEDAKSKIWHLRKNLKTVDECIYDRLQKILKLHQARENREKLLQKLEDIACLRDAQSTKQHKKY
uniref:Exocyst complex component Sec8 N-terminal domain-containing protein n=1 Tax=Acrobeloides nanus TaxID=290746 RepID=A0A914D128_9BILA